jgi:hypothetical protein
MIEALPPTGTFSLFIPYQRFDVLAREIARCQRMTALTGEPYCISLEGPTGAGKTRLARTFVERNPPYETEEGLQQPVFYMVTPAETTIKGLAEGMLQALGDPAAHKGTRTQMDYRLDHLIRACGVQQVILDDFHHLLNIATDKRLKAVSDWLKVRIKNTGKTFLIVGIEGEISKILHYNPQLARLFAARTTLMPFAWDVGQKDAVIEFDLFVRQAETALQIQLTEQIPRVELLYRLHYATGGLVGNVMTLLRYAAILALEQDRALVGLDILAAACASSMGQRLYPRQNPFLPEHGARFNPKP